MSDKRNDAARLGSQTLVVFGGNIFTLILGLPFQIYLARSLGAEQLGLFGLVEAAMTTIAALMSLGIAPTVLRFIPDHLVRGEHGYVRELMLWSTIILLTIGLGLVLTIFHFAKPILDWWEIDDDLSSLVQLMAFTIPISLVAFLYQQILRAFHEILLLVLATSVVMLTSKIALTIWLFARGGGVESYAIAVIFSGGITLLMLIGTAWRLALRLPPDQTEMEPLPLRRWLRYALIMHTGSIFDSATSHIDRFLVGALLGPQSVAILIVVRQLQNLPTLFHQAFLMVVAPMFATSTGAKDSKRRQALFHMTTDWVTRLALPMLLFLAVFAGPMIGLYGEEYRASGQWLLLIGLAVSAVNFGCGPTGSLLMMSGEEAVLLRYSIYSTAINLLGYVLFIPAFGIIGVGLAQLSSTLFLNGMALAIARSRLKLIWGSERYWAWMVSGILVLGLLLLVKGFTPDLIDQFPSSAIILSVTLLCSYIMALVVAIAVGLHDDDLTVLDEVKAKLGLKAKIS